MPPGRGGPEGPLSDCVFFFELRNAAQQKALEAAVRRRGGKVEVFLSRRVTHAVTDDPKCGRSRGNADDDRAAAARSNSPVPLKRTGGQRSVGYGSRTDAMLESVYGLPQTRSLSVLQQARLWNIPIWTHKKVERFLNEISAIVQKRADLGTEIFTGSYIKFESLDRRNRAVYREFSEWPKLNLRKDHVGSPFAPLEPRPEDRDEIAGRRRAPAARRDRGGAEADSPGADPRMTRKTRPRPRERPEAPPRRNGYCEICRASYSTLTDHERTSSHVSFVKNCSNFLSLDSLIDDGTDVETFLKMNKASVANGCCERRSLRNVVRLHREGENRRTARRRPRATCDADPDGVDGRSSPREGGPAPDDPQISPSTRDGGHYLRSKGGGPLDGDARAVSPKEASRRDLRNGSLSPRIVVDKHFVNTRINGKVEEGDPPPCGPVLKAPRARSIRWRRPSPESNPPPPDNRTYYKVVGMSTKLRSSNSFAPSAPRDVEPAPPPPRLDCNGDSDTGLVVKFRRVRRSELSVLSDEAENFMFPKKDDADSTEDEIETTHSNNLASGETLPSSEPGSRCRVKEEVLSGDDGSQDSCGSDVARRKGKRRTQAEAFAGDAEGGVEKTESKNKRRSLSESPDVTDKNKTDPTKYVENSSSVCRNDYPSQEKCLKWEDGKLKASPEVENLTYTFEQIPSYEPWYDTFKRQDEGKEKCQSIAHYLGYYWKSPILPYEMGHLPPLKPNCCSLSQLKKPAEARSGPSRPYGTRGMKKRKIKLESILNLGRNPRKSPREHASTLAILGSLVHKKRNKTSSSDDSKSLPSIAEEEVSSDIPLMLKLPEIGLSESSKKLEEFFSSICDDEDYDTLVDNLDQGFKFEESTSRTNVIDLLQNYDQCDVLENTVKEIQENIQKSGSYPRRRKGCKFKKKNKTGWPAKKRVPAKKEPVSSIESIDSSLDASVNREGAESEDHSSAVLGETHICVDRPNNVKDNHIEKIKGQNVNYLVLENNENSITSFSDMDEKNSNSSKCKVMTDTECSNSEDENFSSNIDANSKHWESSERGLSDRTNSEGDKSSQHSNHHSRDLQPVVRVQKIDTKGVDPGGKRKLRSSGPQRKLRTHPCR